MVSQTDENRAGLIADLLLEIVNKQGLLYGAGFATGLAVAGEMAWRDPRVAAGFGAAVVDLSDAVGQSMSPEAVASLATLLIRGWDISAV